MLGFVVFVLGVLVVAALLFLGASLLLGRGETQPPADLERSPVELPDDRPVTGDDVRALRLSVTVRGYRMSEVDWLLEQFALTIDERDAEILALRAELRERTPSASVPTSGREDGDGGRAGHGRDQHHPHQHEDPQGDPDHGGPADEQQDEEPTRD